MAPATAAPPSPVSDKQLVKMLALMRDADSVELKLTIPDEHQRSAIVSLGMDPLDGQIRLVYFLDTPDLELNQHGLVVRARRVQRKGDDTVIKLRPVIPAELSDELRESPGFVVEVDAMPGGHVCSASLKGRPRKCSVQDAMSDGGSIRRLYSKEQRRFFAANAPEGIELDDLTVLGPIFVVKLKSVPPGYNRDLVVELWLYPDGTRIVELSTKCAPDEAFQVAAEARAFLAERGISTTGEQTTKTRTALEFFSGAM
jgi:hypothetical protein